MPYRLLIDLEVVSFLQTLSVTRRRSRPNHFRRIEQFPLSCSDYSDEDAQGRRVEVAILDGLAIYHWIDEADRHVKILQLIVADTPDPS